MRLLLPLPLSLLLFLSALLPPLAAAADLEAFKRSEVNAHLTQFFDRSAVGAASESKHTNNWAVLVCSSRYWFNYRVRRPLSCAHAARPTRNQNP
jgi:phosphatidylinositol glycan class K